MKRVGLSITMGLLALGCDIDREELDPAVGLTVSARQWDCERDDDRFTCSAAMTIAEGESGAYVCSNDEEREACPPLGALDALTSEPLDELDAMPWACLLTGEHQRQCIKDTGTPAEAEAPEPSDDEPPTAPDPTDDPDSDYGSGDDPEIPGDCDPSSWEVYFCDLATSKFQQHGIDIAFPCDIFDAYASFESTLPDVPTGEGSAPADAPSCHDAEWDMREQAWLDSVVNGCFGLNDPILVMCQQAANYAPGTGECRATGTW